ncbi:extracellular solute-binding protein (plasmid) [Embleya sp. NBC_00888]|uniref:extracellular solute-binding protein n=1 Tax=Embleya sp. NBC_00888 TaxID=2975960 RepID=UPI002F90A633|nr:extracellular solute-binding protein [Embleya sp. NBC_00888]
MLKRMTAALGAAVLLVPLAACGGSSGSDGATRIKVVMAQYSPQSASYWKDVVQRFEAANPKVKVDLQVLDWNTILQQVPTMIQTKSFPDVLNYNAFSEYAKAGLLYNLDEVTDPQLRSDFQTTFTQNASLDGKPYGIPWIASVRSLGYNKDALAKLGVAEPPKTWDELRTVAEKAKQAGYTGYGLPLGSEEAQAEFSLWMWGNGGDWKTGGKWSINSPKNVETLKFLRGLSSAKLTEENPGKANRTDAVWSQFAQGNVAMAAIMPLGTFQSSVMKDSKVNWASAPFPVNAGGTPSTLGVQDYLLAFKKRNNQAAVKSFLTFAYDKGNYLKFVRDEGFLPVTGSASAEMAGDPVAGPGIALMPTARFYPLTDPAWNAVMKAVQSELGTAMEPGADPKAVLDSLQKTAERG